MKFTLATPYGVTYNDDTVLSVSVPTKDGVITLLPDHAALISVVIPGELLVEKDQGTQVLSVSHGVVEVSPGGEVVVLANTSERVEHLDIARAEAAKQRAEELMAQKQNMLDIDFARIQAKLEKELVRISVGNRYKK
ncbi:MAG: ATP synthase F1 subunit epsilon [Candidatus Magasanikbacteria bacterium]|jgi:F-type H+-transporting ATPase subunit epsilon|nr:ATP synthase F1 subunit epsilon [Candidatus Magasanikbacteria bacterium]MBT5262795.1 ATP synthase F1 subunit epsilon [Candidatus Magasanikbacteria bacterium]MBT5820055.1 ATP synthase F1 subunit epsilon [Candidatus Magasanikbacteria bacterium]MBT6294377.1 ATP synthase F1 subunit epsilon [Candidatus Magasanikbacteria bacterium]